MSINKHHNHDYDGGTPDIPEGIGDAYFAQDLGRDFWYQIDRLGQAINDIYSQMPVVVRGGIVRQGSGLNLNISAGVAYAPHSVNIPDNFGTIIPPAKISATVEAVRFTWPDLTNIGSGSPRVVAYSTIDDNLSPNYVKFRYAEEDGNTRARRKKAGSYAYERVPSYEIIVNGTEPVSNEVLLAIFTSNGSTYEVLTANTYRTQISNFDQLRVDWTYGQRMGLDTTITSMADPSISAAIFASNGAVNMFDNGNNRLTRYQFVNNQYQVTGTPLAFTVLSGLRVIATIGPLDVALIDENDNTLKTYRFISTWSQTGSTFTFGTSISNPAVAALDSDTIVMVDATRQVLEVYSFDSTNWTLISNSLNVGTTGAAALTCLNSSTIVYKDNGTNFIRTFNFNGSTITEVGYGNTFNTSNPTLTTLNATDIAMLDSTNNAIYALRFDGQNWTQIGLLTEIVDSTETPVTVTHGSISAVNGSCIAVANEANTILNMFRLNFDILGKNHMLTVELI